MPRRTPRTALRPAVPRRPAAWLSGVWTIWLWTAVVCNGTAVAEPAREEPARRVVAVGDVHGALEPLRQILREVELIDAEDRWIGGRDVLVQTGDFLDRGHRVRAVVALLRDLQEQASAAGGRVEVLLGNHEALNLMLDLRDVDPESVAPFAGRRADRRRRSLCRDSASMKLQRLRHAAAAGADDPLPEARALEAACIDATPPGWIEYLEATGPDGDLGRWLRSLPAAAEVDGTVFVHGGLSAEIASQVGEDVAAINARVAREIATFDRLRAWLLDRGLILVTSQLVDIAQTVHGVDRAIHSGQQVPDPPATEDLVFFRDVASWYLIRPDGPLWFRDYARWSEEEGDVRITAILHSLGARRLAVGHTPQKSGIQTRFDDRVFLLDTGMLAEVYGGRPAALVIAGDRVEAAYTEGKRVLLSAPAAE